jgi:hypothetical protein
MGNHVQTRLAVLCVHVQGINGQHLRYIPGSATNVLDPQVGPV